MAGAVRHQKFRALQGLLGHSVPLQNGEGAEGIVIEAQRLRVPSVYHHRLRGGVDLIVVRGLVLCHHICAGEQLGQHDLPIDIGGVKTVGTGETLIIRGQFTVRHHDFELSTSQGLLGHFIVFFNDKPALGRNFVRKFLPKLL